MVKTELVFEAVIRICEFGTAFLNWLQTPEGKRWANMVMDGQVKWNDFWNQVGNQILSGLNRLKQL